MTPAELTDSCESIGRNCEFGIYQRSFGLEPVSLLRWAGSDFDGLVAAINAEFDGLLETATGADVPEGQPPDKQEWWLSCDRYGINFHSGHTVSKSTAAEATAGIRERTRWLARKLVCDIQACEKILVYSSAELHSATAAEPLISAVRRLSLCPMLLAIQVDGSDGALRDAAPGVWIAEMPYLTGLYAATGLDMTMWGIVMKNFCHCLGSA